MKFIDMHCDSLMQLFFRDHQRGDLYDSAVTSVDFKRMKKGGQLAQFFAIFMPPSEIFQMFGTEPVTDEEYVRIQKEYLDKNIERNGNPFQLPFPVSESEKSYG